jgi:hypothetical protein
MYGAGSVFICMYIHIYIHISGQQTWAVRRIHRENAFSIRDLVQEVCDYIYIYIYIYIYYIYVRAENVGRPPHPARGDHLNTRPSAGSELKVGKN